MLNEEILEDLAMELLREAMIHPTDDVQTALDNAAQMESGRASEMYDLYYSVKDDLIGRGQMGCPDTGNLTFFIALGGGTVLHIPGVITPIISGRRSPPSGGLLAKICIVLVQNGGFHCKTV